MKKRIAIILVLLVVCLSAVPAAAASELDIVAHIQNPTFAEYGVATYEIKAYGYNLYCTWYLEYAGGIYNISDTSTGVQPWEPFAGETYGDLEPEVDGGFTTFRYEFRGIGPELNGSTVYAVITNGHQEVTSRRAYIRLAENAEKPPIILVPTDMEVYQGETLDLHCQAVDPLGGTLYYQWHEAYGSDLHTVVPLDDGMHKSATLRCDTADSGTRYYVCEVETSNGGHAFSSTIRVNVLETQNIPIQYTQDSAGYIGHTLTVDIMAMMDADARIWNAVLENTVKYQWYKDGAAIAGANGAALALDESFDGSLVHVVITCDNLVLRGIPFEITPELPPLEITTDNLPAGQVGEAYSFQLQSNDSEAAFQLFTEADNAVFEQLGLKLDANGTVSGIPTRADTCSVTIFASSDRGTSQKTYTLTIGEQTVAEPESPTISTTPVSPVQQPEGSLPQEEKAAEHSLIWVYVVLGLIATGICTAVVFALKKNRII